MVYVGSGNVSSDELDMNIGNTTFNTRSPKWVKMPISEKKTQKT